VSDAATSALAAPGAGAAGGAGAGSGATERDACDLEIYQIFRGQIEHEDDLIGHRVNWLLAAESFLFVGYETALGLDKVTKLRGAAITAHLTIYVLPVLGMALAVLAELAIVAASIRLNELRNQFKADLREHPSPIFVRCPRITAQKSHRRMGRLQALCVAPLFLLAWAVLLVVFLAARI